MPSRHGGGTYTATLCITAGGITATATGTIDVTAPAAIDSSEAPSDGQVGTPISLSVAQPSSGETYAWTVTRGAGGPAFASGSGWNFTFTPDMTGTYQVQLAASDAAGGHQRRGPLFDQRVGHEPDGGN